MMEFSHVLAAELYGAIEIERERELVGVRRAHEVRQSPTSPPQRPTRTPRLLRPFRNEEARMRRELFAHALEAAQEEGITVDEWFAGRRLDPALSDRARWTGLLDEQRASAA